MYTLQTIIDFFASFWSYLLLSYFLGAIPFGLLIGLSIKKVDVRKHGSGNLGATNVTRILGKKLGAFTLFLDALKGAIPVVVASQIALQPGIPEASINNPFFSVSFIKISFGFVAFLGHCYPIYLKFDGGKGIATGAGVSLIFAPYGFLAAFILFLTTFFAFKKVSLSALLAALIIFIYTILNWQSELTVLLTVSSMILVILLRHKENIKRLISGAEAGV